MSQFSGFVPIKFHLAGKILIGLGVLGFLVIGVSIITGWFKISMIFLIVCLVMVLMGSYMVLILSRENDNEGNQSDK
jgi:uncharacterized membrane protein